MYALQNVQFFLKSELFFVWQMAASKKFCSYSSLKKNDFQNNLSHQVFNVVYVQKDNFQMLIKRRKQFFKFGCVGTIASISCYYLSNLLMIPIFGFIALYSARKWVTLNHMSKKAITKIELLQDFTNIRIQVGCDRNLKHFVVPISSLQTIDNLGKKIKELPQNVSKQVFSISIPQQSQNTIQIYYFQLNQESIVSNQRLLADILKSDVAKVRAQCSSSIKL